MKKVIFFLLVLIPLFSFSQDRVVIEGGKEIKCKITDEDSTTIYLTLRHTNGNVIHTTIKKEIVETVEYDYKAGDADDIKNCVTIGILQGGGSLFGVDYERMLGGVLGIQVGAGLVGYGTGLNFHFNRSIRSSFMSLQYWHQGAGDSFTQSLFSANYVYRSKKWFTAQIGMGVPLDKGPAWPESVKQPGVMLTYSIGGYIPF